MDFVVIVVMVVVVVVVMAVNTVVDHLDEPFFEKQLLLDGRRVPKGISPFRYTPLEFEWYLRLFRDYTFFFLHPDLPSAERKPRTGDP